MTAPPFDVGAFVLGGVDSPRALVRHQPLLTAYADGVMAEKGEDREAYLSHFAFGPEMTAHHRANRQSVAEYAGPCWCRWLILDIDRPNLVDALADARRLVQTVQHHYPETEGDLPIYFSGNKGFHVLLELVHNPPPAVGFHHVCRTLAEALAAHARVKIDTSIYSVNQPLRLPNTRHPKTGLFKRRIDSEALFKLDLPGILELAKHPCGDGIPTVRTPPPQLVEDWHEAEKRAASKAEAHAAIRREYGNAADTRAPRYFVELLRFGVDEGKRHHTLFRCAAWLTEQGAPPSLVFALLTEPGQDVGLTPKDVERQIRCGIEHALRQRSASADPAPDPNTDPDGFERLAIQHEADPLPPDAMEFPFGALATTGGTG